MQVINGALELEPENSDLHAQLDVNAALNNFDKSISKYRRALALNRNLTAHVGLLRAFKGKTTYRSYIDV